MATIFKHFISCSLFYGVVSSLHWQITVDSKISWLTWRANQVLHGPMTWQISSKLVSQDIETAMLKRWYTVKPLIQNAPNLKNLIFLVSSCSCLCAIYWSLVLSEEWRCGWSSANRGRDAPTTSEWSTVLLPTNVWLILDVWQYALFYVKINFNEMTNDLMGNCSTFKIFMIKISASMTFRMP